MLITARKYCSKLLRHMWLWELVSTLVALISTLGIFILLFRYDGRFLRDWTFYFTLNSVLSAFAMVWQICVRAAVSPAIFQLGYVWFTRERRPNNFETFDNASRGGIAGILEMIWLRRCRGLESLGAFILILTVLGHPLIQQIVIYPEELVKRDSAATIGRNTVYNEWTPGPEMDVKSVAPSMVAAIMTGLYNNDTTSIAIKPTCPTGNCTFSPFTTQGFGSMCSNVDSLIESSCSGMATSPNCTVSLPNGGPSMTGEAGLLNSTTVILDASHYNQSTMVFPHIPRQVATVQIISRAKGSDAKVTAMQCIIYVSIDTYNSSVVNGILTEHVVSSWTDSSFIGPGTPDWVSNPRQIPGGPYRLSYNSVVALQTYFWMLFSGSVNGSNETSIPSSDTMALFAELMSEGTLATRMDNLALAMTYHLRRWRALNSTTDSDENTAFGEAKSYQAYIHVNWFWLILPTSVPCLTLFLLLGTMRLTHKKALSTFKSNPLVLIFAGLSDEYRARFGRIEDVHQIHQNIEGFAFRLEMEETGLRFVPRRQSTGSVEMV